MDRQLSNGAVRLCITPFLLLTAPIPLVRMAALVWISLKMILI